MIDDALTTRRLLIAAVPEVVPEHSRRELSDAAELNAARDELRRRIAEAKAASEPRRYWGR